MPAANLVKETNGCSSPFLRLAAKQARKRRAEASSGQTLEEAPERCARQSPGLPTPALVELRGIEPLTSAVRLQRSPI